VEVRAPLRRLRVAANLHGASNSIPHTEPRADEVIVRRVVHSLARSDIALEIVREPGNRSRNWTACRPADPVFPIISARYRNSPKRIVCGMKRAISVPVQ